MGDRLLRSQCGSIPGRPVGARAHPDSQTGVWNIRLRHTLVKRANRPCGHARRAVCGVYWQRRPEA